jgi:transposase
LPDLRPRRRPAASPPARQPGPAEDLKVLSDYRDELLVARNAEANRLHADLAIVCPGYAQVCRRLTAERSLAAAEQLLAEQLVVRAQVARRRISRLRELDREIRDLAGQLSRLVAASRTRLTGLVGVGPILAARILGEVGDVGRFPDADHFAAANGTAPIPVASGRTDRHRLNRGGNRRLNRALHYVALTQATWEPRAVAYLARKQAEGKTRREALRCLKRRLSTVIFKTLLRRTHPSTRPHRHQRRAGRLTIEAQRQGRAVQPHPGGGLGLPADLRQRSCPPGRLRALAALV